MSALVPMQVSFWTSTRTKPIDGLISWPGIAGTGSTLDATRVMVAARTTVHSEIFRTEDLPPRDSFEPGYQGLQLLFGSWCRGLRGATAYPLPWHLSTGGTTRVTSGASPLPSIVLLSRGTGRTSGIWIGSRHATPTFLVCKLRCFAWHAN